MTASKLLAVAVAVGLVAHAAEAAVPRADVVVVWAPGVDRAPIVAVGRELGVGVIDQTPATKAQPETAAIVAQAIRAYDTLDFDVAWTALEKARELADATGGAALTTSELADLFLYRGLVRQQRGEANAAWDELVTSAIVDPTRRLDPVRFSPKVVEDVRRAQTEAEARAHGSVAVDVPAGCKVVIDGRPFDTAQAQLAGPHWLNVACADRLSWGARVVVSETRTTISPKLVELTPPADGDVLVQARAAGVRAVIVAEVRGNIATARLLGLDGRERDRRTVALTGDLTPLASAIRTLARPGVEVAHQPWYRSRWAIAAAAAIVTAAIAIPVSVGLAGDRQPTSGTIGGPPP